MSESERKRRERGDCNEGTSWRGLGNEDKRRQEVEVEDEKRAGKWMMKMEGGQEFGDDDGKSPRIGRR